MTEPGELKPDNCPFCGAMMVRSNWHSHLWTGHKPDCALYGYPLFDDGVSPWNRRPTASAVALPREPTEAMLSAYIGALNKSLDVTDPKYVIYKPQGRSRWQAMLDASGLPTVEAIRAEAFEEALAVPTIWSEEECAGLLQKYDQGRAAHGLTETLFGVVAWYLRHKLISINKVRALPVSR